MNETLIQKIEVSNKKIKELELKKLLNDDSINSMTKDIENIGKLDVLNEKPISYLIKYSLIAVLLFIIITLCPNTIYPLLFCIFVIPAYILEENTNIILKIFHLPYLYFLKFIYKIKGKKLNNELNKIKIENDELNRQYEKILKKDISEEEKLLKRTLEEKIILTNNKVKRINNSELREYYTNILEELIKSYDDNSSIGTYLISFDNELLYKFNDLEKKVDVIINNQYVNREYDADILSNNKGMNLSLVKRN